MASQLDSILNDLVGRLREVGIGRGTAAQQPGGPSYRDNSGDSYSFAYDPEARPTKADYGKYKVPTVSFSSGMLGGDPIQIEQEVPEQEIPAMPDFNPPLPRSEADPRPEAPNGEDVSVEQALEPVRPPLMEDYTTARVNPFGESGMFLGRVGGPRQPERQDIVPTPGATPSTLSSLSARQPEVPRGMLEGPTMFEGQLGMPETTSYEGTYGNEYENLKGKSIEEIRLQLNNPNIDVNEDGDLIEILERSEVPGLNGGYVPTKVRVMAPAFMQKAENDNSSFKTQEELDAYLDTLGL